MSNINFDDFILMHYNENTYHFTGVENIEAALEYMYAHTTRDFIHNAVFTRNEDGEGARADTQTTWIIHTTEDLPSEFFTKVVLSPEGEVRKQAMLDERAAREAALQEFLRNNPPSGLPTP